jgi:myo-inositol-1(or 4)-monophosphatase
VYGQLVGILGKYSKFASAGEKAALRQGLGSGESDASTVQEEPDTEAVQADALQPSYPSDAPL